MSLVEGGGALRFQKTYKISCILSLPPTCGYEFLAIIMDSNSEIIDSIKLCCKLSLSAIEK